MKKSRYKEENAQMHRAFNEKSDMFQISWIGNLLDFPNP